MELLGIVKIDDCVFLPSLTNAGHLGAYNLWQACVIINFMGDVWRCCGALINSPGKNLQGRRAERVTTMYRPQVMVNLNEISFIP